MFGLRYLANVTTLTLDETKCSGCGMCLTVCPHGVFVLKDGKSQIKDRDACMECGACARNCRPGALTVNAGVGCLEAVIRGALTGTEPTCDCNSRKCCCG